MTRIPATTLHIVDRRTGIEICRAHDPQTVKWLRRELRGVSFSVEPEWKRRLKRMKLRFRKSETEPAHAPAQPLNIALNARRIEALTHRAHLTMGDHLSFMTIRETRRPR